eukprot:TRINITY_DN501_c2_g1_i1.p1 TRINITY_DN501_c2_g1~~TRINITY_DN501_c2_g1_i1.p1  ORF type:complete len:223 (+),score=38.68 TRINITY_DN501_c2_g1_i1:56-724(+)
MNLNQELISQLIGRAIVLGAFSLKIPQMFKIIKAGNADGVSELTTFMETFIFATSFCYGIVEGFPLETFAENGICGAQCAMLFLMLMYYNKNLFNPAYILSFVAIIAYTGAYYTGQFTNVNINITPETETPLFKLFFFSVVPLGAMSKIPQIVSFYKAKSTGTAAFLTWFMNFGGSVARIFTTMSQVGDPVMLAGFIINAALGSIIMLQFLMYWNSGKTKTE